MNKLFIALMMLVFTACNSKSPSSKESTSANAAKAGSSNWTREDEMEFLDACVAGSSERLGEQAAFDKCKCILRKLQAENPQNDSTLSDKLLSDNKKMTALAEECDQ